MSQTKYERLEDDGVARPGCLRRLFQRRPPTPEERAREAEKKLRLLMRQLPAWTAEQQRAIKRNEELAKECASRGNMVQAKVHVRAVFAHRRYQERLGAFYTNVNDAMLMQSNAKVARQIGDALGVASKALDHMMQSMSSENIVKLMDKLQDQREDLEEIDEELARPVGDPILQRQIELADEDPEVVDYLRQLEVPLSEPRQQAVPMKSAPVKQNLTGQKKQLAVAQ